ncbi:MAG TPA: hypothetical protein PKB06_00725, partial [Actinotalea sp.]|nr:hypothetical protein [Actinotalea sp.]
MSVSPEPHDPAPEPAAPPAGALSARAFGRDRESVLARERAEFGGFKPGSAFFGWLAAAGTAVLLSALLAGVGAVVGVTTGATAGEVGDAA